MERTLELPLAAGFTNAGAAMKTAGWNGYNRLFNSPFLNDNAETVYIHVTRDGRVPPVIGDATKGIPFGATANAKEYIFNNVDAGLTWLYVAAPVTIKALVKDS